VEGGLWVELRDEEHELPFMCNDCFNIVLQEEGKQPLWPNNIPEEHAPHFHFPISRTTRWIYVLKLKDGNFYVGQTTNLVLRRQEHQDGKQHQAKGKDPKLVYYRQFDGVRANVDWIEDEFTLLNQSAAGRRKLREILEKFREPLRLLDLEA